MCVLEQHVLKMLRHLQKKNLKMIKRTLNQDALYAVVKQVPVSGYRVKLLAAAVQNYLIYERGYEIEKPHTRETG